MSHRVIRKAVCWFAVAIFVTPALLWAAERYDPRPVKAVLINKIAQYITWPEARAVKSLHEATLCYVGDDKIIKQALESLTKNSVEDVTGEASIPQRCHALFISESQEDKLDSLLENVAGKPILTISDIRGFTDRQGMIGLVFIEKSDGAGNIRFEINVKSLNAAELRVDPQLLSTALKVIR